jgi:hypothetical protein
VRFGFYPDVNAGGGATPEPVERTRGKTTFVFPEDDTRLPAELERERNDDERPDDGTVRARLYAERISDRKPVFGTTTVEGILLDTVDVTARWPLRRLLD